MTITFVLGEDGIINKAKESANAMNNVVVNDQKELDSLLNELDSVMNGWEEGGTGGNETTNTEPTPPVEPETPKLENTTGIQTENTKVEDKFGNVVTIPKGFEVVEQEGTTVPEGIVIQDKAGNQFVWIPVGRVYKDDTKNNYSDIQLGRYTFDRTNGTPTPVQLAYTDSNPKNYEQLILLNFDGDEYKEYATRANPDGIESNGLEGLNAIAKDLAGFVNSVKLNGGYYIARYEASYGSGSSVANYKPLSKVSTATSFSTSRVGSLWNNVTQIEAAKISRNMYKNDSSVGVESDLINSYAWDTAIVYIQAMGNGNENYANKRSVNSSIANTGNTGDKVCNIHDMASNCFEWSTEYSTNADSSSAYPCVYRGGSYGISGYYTAYRYGNFATFKYSSYSFRPALYAK